MLVPVYDAELEWLNRTTGHSDQAPNDSGQIV